MKKYKIGYYVIGYFSMIIILLTYNLYIEIESFGRYLFLIISAIFSNNLVQDWAEMRAKTKLSSLATKNSDK